MEEVDPLEYEIQRRRSPSPSTLSPISIPMEPMPNRAPLSPDHTNRKFHLPFGTPPSPEEKLEISPSNTTGRIDDLYEPGTPSSSAFPVFAPPSNSSSFNGAGTWSELEKEMRRDELSDSDAFSSLRWTREQDVHPKHKAFGKAFEADEIQLRTNGEHLFLLYFEMQRTLISAMCAVSSRPTMSGPSADLMPAIWRLVLFQM